MAEAVIEKDQGTDVDADSLRVYEIGYHVAPSVKEEDVEKVVAKIREMIGKEHGSFIAEGAPSLVRLSYPMQGMEGGKRVSVDRAYFGWLKFEAPTATAQELDEYLKHDGSILRHIVFRTVREETRAHLKAPQLREVRRTDTIKSTPRRAEESAAPVSEAELDKALEGLTQE